jgi:hypothetical protein
MLDLKEKLPSSDDIIYYMFPWMITNIRNPYGIIAFLLVHRFKFTRINILLGSSEKSANVSISYLKSI